MTIDSDLAEFVGRHSSHGPLTRTATEPTPNGYMVEVACSRGVAVMRWVTPPEPGA